ASLPAGVVAPAPAPGRRRVGGCALRAPAAISGTDQRTRPTTDSGLTSDDLLAFRGFRGHANLARAHAAARFLERDADPVALAHEVGERAAAARRGRRRRRAALDDLRLLVDRVRLRELGAAAGRPFDGQRGGRHDGHGPGRSLAGHAARSWGADL